MNEAWRSIVVALVIGFGYRLNDDFPAVSISLELEPILCSQSLSTTTIDRVPKTEYHPIH